MSINIDTVFKKEVEFFKNSLKNNTVASVEESHKKIMNTYNLTMEAISKEKQSIARSLNQDMDRALAILDIEDNCGILLKTLNNEVLTYYPTAKIFYGNPCISSKKSPEINSSNQKTQEVLGNCSFIREIRGDGNCFLYCLITRFMEQKTTQELLNIVLKENSIDGTLKEEIISSLLYLSEYPSQIENILKDNTKILPFVKYFRILAADEMKKNKDQFQAALSVEVGNGNYDNFIAEHVLKMGVDFNHVTITALCQRLNFSVTIVDLRVENPTGFNVLDNLPSQGTFCLSAKHYYVLYKKTETSPSLQISNAPKQDETLIQCSLPFGHTLFIRGNGGKLNWNQGIPLTMLDQKTWRLPTTYLLGATECKFILNDTLYEKGEGNRSIAQGQLASCHSPEFDPMPAEKIEEKPVIHQVNAMISYDAGWGNQLGVCFEPEWDNSPIPFTLVNNEWQGQVPVNSKWKFVKICQGKVIAWEKAPDRTCDESVPSIHYDPSSVRF